MSSKDEYHPPLESTDEGLRRSKRIFESVSEKKICPPKIAKKTNKKPTKKFSSNTKSIPCKKRRPGRPLKTEESSNCFNGSCLTPEELQQLFMKFKRDGHFHANPPNMSPPPIVISRTTDGKFVTTKIECYESEQHHVRDFASSITAQRIGSERSGKANDKTSVIFSTPLTKDPSEKLISTSTSPGQLIAPKEKPTNANPQSLVFPRDKNSGPYLTNNCVQKTQNSLLNPHTYSDSGNGFLENSAGPNIHPQFSAAGNSPANGSGLSSDLTDFSGINSAQQTLPVRPNAMFKASASSTWIPPSQSSQETQNDSNTQNSTFPPTNSNFPLHNSTFPPTNSNLPLHNSTFPPTNSNFPLQNSTFPLYNSNFPLRNADFPLHNSTFPLLNSVNMSNGWNAANGSTMANNAMIFLPGNPINYTPPQSMPYNSVTVSPNSNSSLSNTSGYYSSYTPWNNVQSSGNSGISASVPPYYHSYNASNAQGRCETATRPVINDQSDVRSQTNFWSQNNEPRNDFSKTNGNVINNNSNVFTITDSDNKEPIDKSVFAVRGSEDPQNSGLRPKVSSSSYDDDISYDNYMDGNIGYDNANLQPTTQKNEYSSKLPSIMSIKTQMQSWYDGSNHSYENNHQSNGVGSSDMYSFETNDKNVDSSDCYIIEETSTS